MVFLTDLGGGLVVVCMTSFTSKFGVTSYVRLLNCYMGHQKPHRWICVVNALVCAGKTDTQHQTSSHIIFLNLFNAMGRWVWEDLPKLRSLHKDINVSVINECRIHYCEVSKRGKSKVLLNWLFDFPLNYKMTHTSNTMVRDVLWILISSLSLWVKLYRCKSLLKKLQWLWRISYLHYTDMVWQRNVSGQISCVKPYLFKCYVPMWCPQNWVAVQGVAREKKYWGVSIVLLLRLCHSEMAFKSQSNSCVWIEF